MAEGYVTLDVNDVVTHFYIGVTEAYAAGQGWMSLAPYDVQPDVGWKLVNGAFVPPASVVNAAALRAKAVAALGANANFLALSPPTTAQSVSQVRALTLQIDAVIRVVLGLVDTTDGA
jgi:hypothetical protein